MNINTDAADCPHYTVIMVKMKTYPADKLSIPRVCLKCGVPLGIYPLDLKDDPKLAEYIETARKEMMANIPNVIKS